MTLPCRRDKSMWMKMIRKVEAGPGAKARQRTGAGPCPLLKALVLVLTMILLAGASSPARASDLLKNPGLDVWEGGVPEGWSGEGGGAIEKAGPEGGGALRFESSGGGAPFIFQKLQARARYRGSLMTFSAWVKTDSPESAYLEFSNRAGMDVSSEPHPGDGLWHRLEVTAKVPAREGAVEWRIRNYAPGVTYVKGAELTTGAGTPAAGEAAGLVMGGEGGALWLASLGALMAVTVVFFRRRRGTIEARLVEAALLLLIISNAMLILKNGGYAAVTANLAWAAFVAAAAVFAASRFRAGIILSLARPGALYLTLMGAAIVILVHSLYRGDLGGAERTAGALYALMVIEVAVIVARKALAYRRDAASTRALSIRIEPRAKHAAKGRVPMAPPPGLEGLAERESAGAAWAGRTGEAEGRLHGPGAGYAERGGMGRDPAPHRGLSSLEITQFGRGAGGEAPRHGEGPGLGGEESLTDKGRTR